MIAYLSGPIENAENDGASWRQDITLWLDHNLEHKVFNPVLETKGIVGHQNTQEFRAMKKTAPNEYKKIVRKIIKLDLNALINNADYLIVKWDKSVLKGGGLMEKSQWLIDKKTYIYCEYPSFKRHELLDIFLLRFYI